MSFEKDITEVKKLAEDGPEFKAANAEEIANRPDNWIEHIEEIDVIRDMFEGNIGSSVNDSDWIKIIQELLKESKKTFSDLEKVNSEMLSLLIALDDATYMAGLGRKYRHFR